jgi:hypothetical protein
MLSWSAWFVFSALKVSREAGLLLRVCEARPASHAVRERGAGRRHGGEVDDP